jgi:hypothetical protein
LRVGTMRSIRRLWHAIKARLEVAVVAVEKSSTMAIIRMPHSTAVTAVNNVANCAFSA